MKIGVIGIGNMGTILIEALIESGAVEPKNFHLTKRSIAKTNVLKNRYDGLHFTEDPCEIVRHCEIVFICVKPLQFQRLLEEIENDCHKETLLVSITSPLSVEQLEEMVDCKVARAIPSVLNRALAGPSLLSFGERCTAKDKETLFQLLAHISTPLLIEENITRVASDIVSCGPAFMSHLLQQFINGAVRQTAITEEEATVLATNMIIGLGKLLDREIYTLSTLQEQVSVPGGITGEGIKVLEAEIGEMFDHLFQQTHAKYHEDKETIRLQMKKVEQKRG